MKKKIVVIGSGLAGSLICNELVQKFDVTLLEKGVKGRIKYPDLRFLNKKFAEVKTCCYGAGGTTNLWHNGLIPISIEDVSDADFREILIDADSYMDRTAAALYYTGNSYAADYRQLKEEVRSFSSALASFPHGIDCLVYPKFFRKLSVSSDVNVIYSVEKINFGHENGRISSVRYSIGGQSYLLKPDVIVLAAGTLGTPGLVQKITQSVGEGGARAGTGFIDHPMGFVGKVKFKKGIADTIKKFSSYDKGEYVSRNAVRLKSACGRYSACAFFRPALTMDNRLAIYKYKSSLGASNGLARLKNIFSVKLFHPDIVAEIFAHLFGVNLPGRIYNIMFLAEQKRGGSSIREEGGSIQVDWTVADEEMSIYRTMLAELRQTLLDLADDVKIETDLSDEWLWSAAHHSGTTSIGSTENDLLDLNLKLKCCDNVYVCDGSVIQEHSYANTGLTIGQLALRLADRIGHGC